MLLTVYGYGYNLFVEISNIDIKRGGQIIVRLFSKDEVASFPYERGKYEKRVVPKGDRHIVVFNQLKKGAYALLAFHDENMNGELDRVLFYRKEGFAFSNNYKHFPSFIKSQINLIKDTKARLKINY
jgi:uncharacterized protein (DUF2141 family)